MKFIFLLFIPFTLFAQKQITLDDIYKKNVFASEFVSGFNSMNDGKYYAEINNEQKLVKMNFATGNQESIIADFSNLEYNSIKIKVADYKFNSDETKILLFESPENIYRRSVKYYTYVLDLSNNKVEKIHNEKVLHPSFSPDGKNVAYVYKNNLYIKPLGDNKIIQITEDGKQNEIINGNCDWVYEEEFEFTQAYQWSNDSKYIAYYKFNESNVKQYNFAMYDNLYPTNYEYKYPKAGEDNSKVEVYVFDFEKLRSAKINIEEEKDIYIPRIKWNSFNNTLLIYKLNRLQNNLKLYAFEPYLGGNIARQVFEENNKYYVEIKDDIFFYKTKNCFAYTSEKNGNNHIYIFDIDKQTETQITTGEWEVTEIKGIDEKKNILYYVSTEQSPMERNLYSIKNTGKEKTRITQGEGTHRIEFSSNYAYYMDAYSKLNTPTVYTINDNKGKLIRTLKDNAKLNAIIEEYKPSPMQLIKVPSAQNGIDLNAWVIYPSNYDDGKKHPLLMFQYSGPGSQQVTNSYMGRDYWWYQMLAQKGYVIACVDGRGTGFRGEEFKKCTYQQLGNLESDDQIAAAKYFATLPQIDASRIGIWGWSYGGYMSSICIMKGADVFKSAIAVAPVTNWRYYDNIYTERYMRKPQDNAKGYDDNSPVNMVDKLKGNYLLIHGSADDNVHYQNTMMMINALVKAGKEFDSEIYPNRNHGISGGNTRYHLYNRLTNFILEKL